MKILPVTEYDFDAYNDWLTGTAETAFIQGDYTHIICVGEIIEAEVVTFMDGTKGVLIGESL